MDLNGSTACYQHCSNGITMYVQNMGIFASGNLLPTLVSNGITMYVQNMGIFASGNLVSNGLLTLLLIDHLAPFKIA